jgi:hypothetical protein
MNSEYMEDISAENVNQMGSRIPFNQTVPRGTG